MPSSDRPVPPVVEPKSTSDASDLTLRALRQRIRQQEILAELGVGALQGPGFAQLLADTARLTAEGLRAEFCRVLEYVPAENRFLVRAGVGWGPGIIGVASIGADLASPAGFALKTGRPVISNRYIEPICKDLSASFAQGEIRVQAQPGIVISADRAISSALIVTELVSNAAKHAYQGQGGGRVWVNIATTSVDGFSISVRDEGAGLPEGFQIEKGRGFGIRVVRALAEQLNASLDVVARQPGAEFILTAQLDP